MEPESLTLISKKFYLTNFFLKNLINKKNPATCRYIKSKTNLSLETINKVINQDLAMDTRKKTKVHKLTENHKMNRKTTCQNIYENNLASQKWEYSVTLD